MAGQLVPRVQHQVQACVVIAFGRLDADEHIVEGGGGRFGRSRCGHFDETRRRRRSASGCRQRSMRSVVQLVWPPGYLCVNAGGLRKIENNIETGQRHFDHPRGMRAVKPLRWSVV